MANRPHIGRSSLLVVLALFMVALVPRYLTAGRALWFDERFTMLNTASVRDALAYCLKGVHPPLYFVLAAIMRIFRYLSYGLAVLLVFIGCKMVLEPILQAKMSAAWSLAIVGAILAAAILASCLAPKEPPAADKPVPPEVA